MFSLDIEKLLYTPTEGKLESSDVNSMIPAGWKKFTYLGKSEMAELAKNSVHIHRERKYGVGTYEIHIMPVGKDRLFLYPAIVEESKKHSRIIGFLLGPQTSQKNFVGKYFRECDLQGLEKNLAELVQAVEKVDSDLSRAGFWDRRYVFEQYSMTSQLVRYEEIEHSKKGHNQNKI